jgi:hypothetical protein
LNRFFKILSGFLAAILIISIIETNLYIIGSAEVRPPEIAPAGQCSDEGTYQANADAGEAAANRDDSADSGTGGQRDAFEVQVAGADSEIQDTTGSVLTLDTTGSAITLDTTGAALLLKLDGITAPELTAAQPEDGSNMIHLDWHTNAAPGLHYMVHKSEAGENAFQTIPLKSTSRVLNIYPGANDGGTISFTNWQGDIITNLSASASVKKWMEEPNTSDPRGFGKGLVTVDCVSIGDFNENPGSILYRACLMALKAA